MPDHVDARLNAFEHKMDTHFKAILTAIAEWSEAELNILKLLASLSERVAVLEARIR